MSIIDTIKTLIRGRNTKVYKEMTERLDAIERKQQQSCILQTVIDMDQKTLEARIRNLEGDAS